MLGLLVERVVGVEVGIELSTTAGLIGEELDRVAHMLLDTSFFSILVVLGARAFPDVEKVDDHGSGERVIPVTTKITDWVRTNVVDLGDVLGGETIRASASGRFQAVTAPAPLGLLCLASLGVVLVVHSNFQADVATSFPNVGEDGIGKVHGGIPFIATDVADGSFHRREAEELQQEQAS